MDRDALLSNRVGTEDVPVAGGTIVLRGLMRDEVVAIRERELAEPAIENAILAAAFVDPALSLEDVETYRATAPAGEYERCINVALRLSGMTVDQETAEARFRTNGSGVRVPAGPGAGDDGS